MEATRATARAMAKHYVPPTTTATTTNRLVDNILLWNEEEGSSTTQSARECNELWKSKFKDPIGAP